MSYVLNGRRLDLASGKSFVFKYKIREAIETDFGIVACLEVPPNRKLEENVYAISPEGKLLWQIPKTEHSMKKSSYVGIRKVGSLIRAFNYDGMVYDLDPKDGRIVSGYFGR